MENNMSDEEATNLTENYIRVGMDSVNESIMTIKKAYTDAGMKLPSMPSLLYGMATTIFETMYICAPSKEEAEGIINMALTTAQENAGEYKKAIEKNGGPLFGGRHEEEL